MKYCWVFHGQSVGNASAIFSTFIKASEWCQENRVSGILSKYPIDIALYDWAASKHGFKRHVSDAGKEDFTEGGQQHIHFEQGTSGEAPHLTEGVLLNKEQDLVNYARIVKSSPTELRVIRGIVGQVGVTSTISCIDCNAEYDFIVHELKTSGYIELLSKDTFLLGLRFLKTTDNVELVTKGKGYERILHRPFNERELGRFAAIEEDRHQAILYWRVFDIEMAINFFHGLCDGINFPKPDAFLTTFSDDERGIGLRQVP